MRYRILTSLTATSLLLGACGDPAPAPSETADPGTTSVCVVSGGSCRAPDFRGTDWRLDLGAKGAGLALRVSRGLGASEMFGPYEALGEISAQGAFPEREIARILAENPGRAYVTVDPQVPVDTVQRFLRLLDGAAEEVRMEFFEEEPAEEFEFEEEDPDDGPR